MSTRAWLVGALAVTAMGVSAQPGLAATVRVVHGQAVFRDAAGVKDDVGVSRRGTRIRFRDISAAVTAGAGCTALGPHRVTCAAAPIHSVIVRLGAAGDRVIVRAHLRAGKVEVLGGRGPDVVRSEGPRIRALGGPGDDRMHGGPRSDWLQGGPGDDVLRPHDGSDIVFGMAGDDVIVGSTGADRIFGGADDDDLFGRAGDDILRGATGEDLVIDLHGTDRLYGGADPDYLNTKDGVTGDYENAGAGPDYGCAASPFPGDVLVGCDERAGPCCIVPRSPAGERVLTLALRRATGAAMP
jgi:RTX calcium-binding nonapeptide repeat (4 copies)